MKNSGENIIVSIPSFYFRNMLLQYDRQLVTARRLARLKAELRERMPAAVPTETKRRVMVEHVARELLDNLLFTGSDNPVVREVRQELNRHAAWRIQLPISARARWMCASSGKNRTDRVS